MATWDDLISRIADDLNRTDLTTQIGVAVNRAITHYQSERTWFNETSDTFTTTSGQESYTSADGLATDIVLIDTVQITDSASNQFVLIPRTWDYIRSLQTKPATYTGLPGEWCWYQERLYLYPTPNATLTGTVWYIKSYADLATGESNDWTTEREALDLIEARATWWIASRVLKDYERANFSKQEEMEALRRVIVRTNRNVSRGTIRPYL
jgi:hypothetical protein